jgi:hypothetical protein
VLAAGEVAQGRAESDDDHRPSLRRVAGREPRTSTRAGAPNPVVDGRALAHHGGAMSARTR